MNTSQELKEMANFAEKQEKLAEEALKVKGTLARYYSSQFSLMPENKGEFVGLACRSCNTWEEYGHAENCPMIELESLKNAL